MTSCRPYLRNQTSAIGKAPLAEPNVPEQALQATKAAAVSRAPNSSYLQTLLTFRLHWYRTITIAATNAKIGGCLLAWRRWQEAMASARNTPPGRKNGGCLFDLHGKHTRDGELGSC